MNPIKSDNVLVFGKDLIAENAIEQATQISQLPFVKGHVALMPDAHLGKGSCVGAVIPTIGAVIPAAVGVDLGCGMAAVKLNVKLDQLPSLDGLMPHIEQAIPAGVGKGRKNSLTNVVGNVGEWPALVNNKSSLKTKAIDQCGTLGSGNHFLEICYDESGSVWVVLHSGSRGVGNEIAKAHIEKAIELMDKYFIELPDKDLAYLVAGTDEFDEYINDMLWAQRYAALNRSVMLSEALTAISFYLTTKSNLFITALQKINCHHNFTELENHHGKNVWVTRKGAIRAREGDWGIIPGSMGTETFIVKGKGDPGSYSSCSHGAGRVHSRSKAKRFYSSADLEVAMAGKVWNSDRSESLVDEIPSAYKDINSVMRAQKNLVSIEHKLVQVFNYKG